MQRRLLVVDDDNRFRSTVVLVMSRIFHVDESAEERDAIAKVWHNNYDVVITDGNLEVGKEGNDDGNRIAYEAKRQAEGAKRVCIIIGVSQTPDKFDRSLFTLTKKKADFDLSETAKFLKEKFGI
jgi:CheY-like chemotaxis protein